MLLYQSWLSPEWILQCSLRGELAKSRYYQSRFHHLGETRPSRYYHSWSLITLPSVHSPTGLCGVSNDSLASFTVYFVLQGLLQILREYQVITEFKLAARRNLYSMDESKLSPLGLVHFYYPWFKATWRPPWKCWKDDIYLWTLRAPRDLLSSID